MTKVDHGTIYGNSEVGEAIIRFNQYFDKRWDYQDYLCALEQIICEIVIMGE